MPATQHLRFTSPSGTTVARLTDVAFVGVLVLANPALWWFDRSLGAFTPDSVAYFVFAEEFWSDFRLFLADWGEPYRGLIYPPLYPALLGLGRLVTTDMLRLSEWVSSACLIAAAVPLYAYVRSTAGALVALATVAAIQLNLHYTEFAFLPLTEALYILTAAIALLATRRVAWSPGAVLPAVVAGLACTLVFLSRQVGAVMLAVSLAWTLSALLAQRRSAAEVTRTLTGLVLGISILLVPYTIGLAWQTGQGPFVQWFWQEGAPTVELSGEGPSWSDPAANYEAGLDRRRELRRLLPDATIMYGSAYSRGALRDQSVVGRIMSPQALQGWWRRAVSNLSMLRDAAGSVLAWAFLIACVSPLVARGDPAQVASRLLVPAFAGGQIVLVSLLSDQIARYVHVLLPFLVVQVAQEAAIISRAVAGRRSGGILPTLGTVGLLAVIVASYPAHPWALPIHPKVAQQDIPLSRFREHVERGEPVLSMDPLYAYLSGGRPRTLPNDSLERVVAFARHTGVRWLLVARTANDRTEIRRYRHARWYALPGLSDRHPALLKKCCAVERGQFELHRILPAQAR